MAKATETKKTSPDEDALDLVLKDFKASWEYTSGSWHQRWQDNYWLYNGQRVKRGYQGITDTFVPMAFGTVETLVSALFGSKPKFSFLPPSTKPDQKTDILNSLVDFYWDKDQWSIKVINTGRTGLQIGTGIDYWYWENDHPCMVNVATRDYFRDPTSKGEETRYQGRRYLTTKEYLESYEVVDLDKTDELGYPTGEMKKKYKNLNKLQADGGSTGDPTDKEEKDMWYGSTVINTEDNQKQVEVIEYWTNDRVISIANRSVVIQDDENPFKAKDRANQVANGKDPKDVYAKGLMPFNWFRDYVDPSLFYAKGEIDFIADQQELLNDITNQNNDAITYSLNPMYTLDPKYGHMINEIENVPGAVYPVEAGTLAPIQMASIPTDAFNERQNIKNEIRETTGSNEVVRGASTQKGADPTATEINAQIAGAGQRISLKITQVENEYFHRMAKIVFEMIKLYVTEPMMVRIMGKDGAKWEMFDPQEFQDEYEPRVQLDIEVEQKKKEAAAEAKEMLAAFLNDPDVNQQELKKLVLQRSFNLDPDEVETLVQPAPVAEDPMAGLMPPDQAQPELPPEMMAAPAPIPEGVVA